MTYLVVALAVVDLLLVFWGPLKRWHLRRAQVRDDRLYGHFDRVICLEHRRHAKG